MTSPAGPVGPSSGIELSVEALKDFEKAIHGVITDLQGGTVPIDDVVTKPIAPTAYGQNFSEADTLRDALAKVTTNVQTAAQTFHKHVQAMQLSIRLSSDHTAATDEAVRQQYADLLRQLAPAGPAPAAAPAAADTTTTYTIS